MVINKGILILLILGVFLISNVSALNCVPSFINRAVEVGVIPSSQSVSCTNDKAYDVSIYKSGTFFSLNPSTITIANGSSSSFAVEFNQMNNEGNFAGFLYSSDGTILNINVNVSNPIVSGSIIIFPTAKIVNIKQGQTKDQSIQVIVPSNYPRQITLQSVSFNPDLDVARFGDLNLGVLNPGQTLNIPLIIDAIGVQTGSYQTQISILATDIEGQIPLSSVNLQIIVSVGVSPSTNATFSTRPDCSLSALELNRNNTYTFTCNNIVENLEVNPRYDEYLEGIMAEYGTNKYTYTFKAKKLGTTSFVATFTYKGSPIFEAFSKDIRITLSGVSPVSGVTMEANFYQGGVKKNLGDLKTGETIIMILDNETSSLIDINHVSLYLNGLGINSTFNLESDKDYELRASATGLGYLDLVLNFSATKTPISISLSPSQSIYNIGNQVNITTNPENASLLINDVIISSPYILNSEGNFTITAKKQGYLDSNVTIKVERTFGFSVSPDSTTFENGDEVYFEFNEETLWKVWYLKSIDDEWEILKNGTGITGSFDAGKKGTYTIKADDVEVWNMTREGKGWFGWWSWWYLIGVIIVVGFVYWVFIRKSEKGEESPLVFSPKAEE